MIKFNSPTQNLLIQRGQLEDEKSRNFIRKALGLSNKKVEATKHTILSGPPGLGKTFGTQDECNKAGIEAITIAPGISDIDLVTKVAYGVYNLKKNQELVVILDDADDVVFGDYTTLNKWKIATGDIDYDQGIIPRLNHSVSMSNTFTRLEKEGKTELLEALQHFQNTGELGVSIPTDKVRFIVLCNLDLEDPKAFNRQPKIKSAIGPVFERFEYMRINLSWEHQWGWLAYVLGGTQPFKDYPLSVAQKKELLGWMYSNWNNLRSTSYRQVRKLAADMINEPGSYIDSWNLQLKGH